MEIKLPVKWLREKGVELELGDIWLNPRIFGPEKISKSTLVLFNDGALDYLSITSFADRECTGDQPVIDSIPVRCTLNDGSTVIGVGSSFRWWRSCNDEAMAKWKPDAKELMEMYTAEQNAKLTETKKETKLKAKTDLEWLALELNEWSYFGMVAHTVIGDEIHWHPSNMQGFTQEQWQDKRYELGLDKKETKLKLTKDDVGKEFLCNGHIAEVCNISDSAERFVLYTSTDGFIIVNKNGESCTSDTFQLEQYEPRYWLKDLPDADLFSKDVSSIHFEGDMNWYVTDVNGYEHWWPYGDLPELDGYDRKLSKISIDDLRVWQKENK